MFYNEFIVRIYLANPSVLLCSKVLTRVSVSHTLLLIFYTARPLYPVYVSARAQERFEYTGKDAMHSLQIELGSRSPRRGSVNQAHHRVEKVEGDLTPAFHYQKGGYRDKEVRLFSEVGVSRQEEMGTRCCKEKPNFT